MFEYISYHKYTGKINMVGESLPKMPDYELLQIPVFMAGYLYHDAPYTDVIHSGGEYIQESGIYVIGENILYSGIWDGNNFHTPELNENVKGIFINVYTNKPEIIDYTISGIDSLTNQPFVWNLNTTLSGIAYDFAEQYYKNHVRELIEILVADDRDLIADISKNVNVIERFTLRMCLHILGIRTMDNDTLTRYISYASNFLDAVDNELFFDRADYEDEPTMIQTLWERRAKIGALVKNRYLDLLNAYKAKAALGDYYVEPVVISQELLDLFK